MEIDSARLIDSLIAAFTCGVSVWAFFKAAAHVVSVEIRDRIAAHINGSGTQLTETWPSFFLTLFDALFGSKHLSWRCFLASSAASLLTVAVVTFVRWLLTGTIEDTDSVFRTSVDILYFAFSLNIIFDYISLLLTRYWLSILKTEHSAGQLALILVADLMFSALVAFLMILFWMLVVAPGWNALFASAQDFGLKTVDVDVLFTIAVMNLLSTMLFTENHYMGIFVYSTFLTSFFLWLYIISFLILKFVNPPIRKISRFIEVAFDVDNKPIESIGFVSAILVFILVFILACLS